MHRALPEILEPLDELERRLSQCRDAYQKPRLHLLVLLARGEVRRREDAAQRLAYHRHTIGQWLREYEEEGLEALLRAPVLGAPRGIRKLPTAALERLAERLEDEQGLSGYQDWISGKRA